MRRPRSSHGDDLRGAGAGTRGARDRSGARPSTPDVFVSYARSDGEFVRALHKALEARGRDCWVDWEDIRPTAEWMHEIRMAIESARAFVYVISPEAASSDICRAELEHASQLNKRIIPVLRHSTPESEIPEPARQRQWIPLRESDEFTTSLESIEAALDTDPEWAQLHTRILVRAVEWVRSGREQSFELRGRDLETAERWLGQSDESKDPQPAALHTEYVIASRRRASRSQRHRIAALSVGLVIALGLAIFAVLQRNRAEDEADVAQSRELATAALLASETNPAEGLVLAAEAGRISPTEESAQAMRRALDGNYLERVLRGHGSEVNGVAYSPDGEHVVTSSGDGIARIFAVANGEMIQSIGPELGALWASGFDPRGRRVVTSSEMGPVVVWSARTGRELRVLEGHTRRVYTAEFSPNGSRIVTAGADGTARVWDSRSGREVLDYEGHGPDDILSAAFSPGGLRVASSGEDGTARIWDADSGRTIRTFRVTPEQGERDAIAVNSAKFDQSGRKLITAGDDGIARVWDVGSGRLVDRLPESSAEVYSASFNRAGDVLTAGLDGTARIWDLNYPDPVTERTQVALLQELRGHSGGVVAGSFSPDGEFAVTGGSDGTARIWQADFDDSVGVLDRHRKAVLCVGFSPDGSRIVTCSGDTRVIVWDAVSKAARTVIPQGTPTWDAEISPNGKLIATAGDDGRVRLWGIDGQLALDLGRHNAEAVSVSFSPDGQQLVSSGVDGTARLWDTRSGREVLTLRGPDRFVFSADFSPDGRRIVTASGDRSAVIWDASSGERLKSLEGHSAEVRHAAFDATGERIVTASEDGTARIWETSSGQTVAVLSGHEDTVYSAAFSPDGDRVATAGSDGTVRIWDASSGALLDVRRGARESVVDVAFHPSGDFVVAASFDDEARIFTCELCVGFDELLAETEGRIAAALSPGERAADLAAHAG